MSRNRLVTFATFTVLFFVLATPSLFAQVSVTAAIPSSAAPGTVNLNVTISGSGFKKGAKSQFFKTGTTDPGDVVVNSTTFSTSSQVIANITVAATAADAAYDIQVMNANGSSGKGTELFGVQNSSNKPNSCTDIPLRLIVAPQTRGMGGISGDSVVPYTGPDTSFAGGSVYTDGVNGVYVKYQVCNGTNDLIINLRNSSPARYLNWDFAVQLYPPAAGAFDVTGMFLGEQGQNINEVANDTLYTNNQFVTCTGADLTDSNWSSNRGGRTHFKPPSVYDPIVLNCTENVYSDLANTGGATSAVVVQKIDACTRILTPALDSTGVYRAGLAELIKTRNFIAGGQFQMPFKYRVEQLGCTP